ncbi:MAG: S8 family serine peptidase, partial [Acidobacteriota bacterium]
QARSLSIKLALVASGFALTLCSSAARLSAQATSAQDEKPAYDSHFILFKRGPVDTRLLADLDTSSSDMLAQSGDRSSAASLSFEQLRLIQFRSAIRREWIERLKAAGAEIIGYIPNNAYIIRGSAPELARVAAMGAGREADDARPVQWMGRYEPIYKIDPSLDRAREATVAVEIELIDSLQSASTIERITRLAEEVTREPRRFLNYVVLSLTLPAHSLFEVAEMEDVLFIAPSPDFRLHDERSAQIVAANLAPNGFEPTGPGYLTWLRSKGLDTTSDFLIDFTDTGLDQGETSDFLVHPDFRNDQGRSRIVYSINYPEDSAGDRKGHGTIVAATACGLGASDRVDAAGYRYGLGVDPFIHLGASRIFSYSGRIPYNLTFTTIASAAYAEGARISNNSWGNGSNAYDAAAQEFDALTRDARPSAEGNQEMLFVFSAGNDGAGGKVSSPGVAKNVISVAASENYRPEGQDSCNLDGEGGIGPEGANSALDILRFSSGGPTRDARAKPDLSAPGTHIYGAASQAPQFNAGGLCPGTPIYQPPGQRFYTWSSGTSLAAPHISGAASLARKFFTNRRMLGDSRPPSPAMLKAYLINSATYLTGENAGGDLPALRQGWGLVDLGRAFDDASRRLVDQSALLTESGQSFEIRGSIADRSKAVRVTLAWTDAPGSLAGASLVNDLDLEVRIGSAVIYRGNHFAEGISTEGEEADRVNNVESAILPAELIPAGYQGNLTITIRAANIAGDGVPGNGNDLDQDFALVVYNITDPLPEPPPEKIPAITAASYFKKTLTITGNNFTASARVEINGERISSAFTFDAIANSLSIRKKSKKLKLHAGDNQIIVIDHGNRSEAFTLRL